MQHISKHTLPHLLMLMLLLLLLLLMVVMLQKQLLLLLVQLLLTRSAGHVGAFLGAAQLGERQVRRRLHSQRAVVATVAMAGVHRLREQRIAARRRRRVVVHVTGGGPHSGGGTALRVAAC